jgi:alanine racemase
MPRVVAHISQSALIHNLKTLAQYANAQILFPIKANAYGHGAVLVAQALEDQDLLWGFAVATPDEALELRDAGIQKPILLLTPAAPTDVPLMLQHNIRLTISRGAELEPLPVGTPIHLKINTGMNRLGVRPEDALDLMGQIWAQGLKLEGLCSHFACADQDNLELANAQLASFQNIAQLTDEKTLKHIANSGGIFSFGKEVGQKAGFDLIRPGISMYGYAPNAAWNGRIPLERVLNLSSFVSHIQTVKAGETVSYGALWTAPRDSQIAVVSCGYADGFPRGARQAVAFLGGELRPVVGRICMDQMMVDATDLELQIGDEVELIGPNSSDATQIAQMVNTIDYEVLTGLDSRRVERTLVLE